MSDSAGNSDTPGPSSDDTRILRRQSENPPKSGPQHALDAPKTGIIRRHPTGSMPVAQAADPQTSFIEPAGSDATSFIPKVQPRPRRDTGPGMAITVAVVSILSGWATAVIATDLIAGWWHTDRLFCVAIGFLTAISAAATIGGLIALLLRHRTGRLLVVVGAIIALLIFGSLFVAGAKLSPVVYAIPALPLASIGLTLLPATRRWAASGRS